MLTRWYMGWRERDYNQYDGGPRTFGSILRNLVFGSVPLGTWLGVRVRVHASLIILIGMTLLMSRSMGGVQIALTQSVLLFAIVLAHEFGHCLAARWVGGHADEILLWPLGGLAFVHTPPRPWPSFVATAGGPLVNVLLCVLATLGIWALTGLHYGFLGLLNPFLPFSGGADLQHVPILADAAWQATFYLGWIYSISWMLLVFNLLPIYPLDGGKLLQEILWPFLGYHRSMNLACLVGMIGGIGMMMVGLATFNLLLAFIGISGVTTCYQMRAMLQAGMFDEYGDTPDYAASLRNPPRRKIRKGWFRMASRRAARERAEQARIDAILAKVHDKGLHSLTWWEKRALRKATERQRQQDLAERL